MNVIVCTHLYPTEAERTAGNHTFAIKSLIEGARDHGVDIRQVIRFQPLSVRGRLTRPHASMAGPLQVIDVPRIGTRDTFSGALTRLVLGSVSHIEAPDVVVCHMCGSFTAARKVFARSGARFIFVAHASDFMDSRMEDCLRRADAVYCRSDALRRLLAERYGMQADGVVFSGVAREEFGSPERAFAANRLRIVMATQLIPLRNVAAVLRALKLLPPTLSFDVDLYGDGPLAPEIRDLVVELDLQDRVHMHGFRPRAEVLRAMQDAHLFVMPSAPETFGLAYLEAMAKGCVVIGHAGWGIDGIVVDGANGYLVLSATPDEIAGKMAAYMASDRDRMHRSAFETAGHYTAEAAGACYAAMIGSVAGR